MEKIRINICVQTTRIIYVVQFRDDCLLCGVDDNRKATAKLLITEHLKNFLVKCGIQFIPSNCQK